MFMFSPPPTLARVCVYSCSLPVTVPLCSVYEMYHFFVWFECNFLCYTLYCVCLYGCVCVCVLYVLHHWALFPHISRFILATFFLSVAFARGEVGLTSFTLTDSLHFLIFVSNFCFYIILFNSGVLSFNFHKLNLCLLVFLLSSNHDRNVMFWFIFIMLSALLRTTAYVTL